MSAKIGATEGTNATARLISRTSVVLGGQVGLAWLGSLATWSVPTTSLNLWALAIIFLATAFGSTLWGASADKDDPSPVLGAAVFAFSTGAFLGPALAMHTAELGAAVVGSVCAASLAGLAAAGTVASLLSFNWRRLESWLIPALWGLIGVQLLGALVSMPAGLHQGVSLAGAGMFLLFMVVDVARMFAMGEAGADSWGAAVVVANNLFLDLANFLLHVLSALGD